MSGEIKKWDDDLSPEAKALLDRMLPNYYKKLEQINRMPISVLIWGPEPDSQSPIGIIENTKPPAMLGRIV